MSIEDVEELTKKKLIHTVIEGYGVADEGTAQFTEEFQALKPVFKRVFDNFDTKVTLMTLLF
jgi:hypothetical protein